MARRFRERRKETFQWLVPLESFSLTAEEWLKYFRAGVVFYDPIDKPTVTQKLIQKYPWPSDPDWPGPPKKDDQSKFRKEDFYHVGDIVCLHYRDKKYERFVKFTGYWEQLDVKLNRTANAAAMQKMMDSTISVNFEGNYLIEDEERDQPLFEL